jgi:SAM-dependent methyltransferase
MLMEDGYDITCSDLETIPALAVTQKLFPGLRFNRLDILKSCAPARYDAMLALSLIYLFSEYDLNTFFRNCSDSLRPGGCLILDSAGAPDNLPAFFWHDICLRIESYIVRVLIWLRRGQIPLLTCKHFGYRRTSAEIISAARAAGFELAYQKDYVSASEFRRSVFFNLLVRQGGLVDKIFAVLGKSFPYTRMYDFRKL